MTTQALNYTKGDLNAWVWRAYNNYPIYNRLYYVYGDYTLIEDKTITDANGEDGLTIMEGANLTISEGVTLTVNDDDDQGIPQITNLGTIENNGTIQFQDTVPDETILALTDDGTLTGSGKVYRGGTEVATINGVVYEVTDTVTDSGLNLYENTPTANTCYKAGDGYILWQPTVENQGVNNGTVTLQNASVNTANKALYLPGSAPIPVAITIVAEGENSLISTGNEGIYHEGGATIVQGSGTLNAQGNKNAIYQQNGGLTFTGDVTVNATGGDGYYDIYAWDIIISDNANVTANGGSASIYSGGNITINTTGTVNAPEINTMKVFELIAGTMTGSWVWEGKTDYHENEVNTIYGNVTIVGEYYIADVSQLDGLTITKGATLTIDNGSMLTIEDNPYVDGVPKIINNGTIENFGTIKFPEGTTVAEIQALNIKGSSTGTIRIGERDIAIVNGVLYPDGGDISDVGVDFTENTPTADTYYKAGNGYMIFSPTNGTLTLHNVEIDVDNEKPIITLPQSNIKLVLEGENSLINMDTSETGATAIQKGEVLEFDGSLSATAPQSYSLRVSGNGSLSVKDYGLEVPSISTDGTFVMESGTLQSGDTSEDCFSLITADFQMKGGSLEVSNDFYIFGNALIQGGSIFTPGSDEYNGVIGCIGNFEMTGGTVTCGMSRTGGLAVNGNIIKTGGTLNALVASIEMRGINGVVTLTPYGIAPMVAYNNDGSEDTNQIITLYLGNAGDGGVTLTGGSTLNVGCDYGVYIIDGKLNIDKTSKLVTNAEIAPFCVVDTTNSKAQSDMVSLPGVPRGTAISSAKGSLAKYWSLVSSGGSLSVEDENSEPVTLSGAVTGTVSFAYTKNSSDDSTSGGGSATYYTITAKAEKGGTISPEGAVSVAKNTDKTFTITPNKGYEVKDVLVDGESVGKVTEYTFDEVSKAHTITATFEEVSEEVEEVPETEVSYADVKDSDWFKEAVDYVTQNGLMAGVGEGKFAPTISTDRGMIVTILWRIEGQPSATAKASFTDVAQGEYYAEAVAWAAENKIVEGYGNGLFGPKDTITREQMASILYRYSKFKDYDTTQRGMAVSEFSDYSSISSWALESVTWAVNADLLSGVNESQLDPNGKATRAQVASILMRYCEDVAK